MENLRIDGITYVDEHELRAMALNHTEQNQRSWAPFDIHVMLHHYAVREPFSREHVPAYKDSLARLTKLGLLAWNEEQQATIATPLGEAMVNMWCETPVPIVRYIDPRYG